MTTVREASSSLDNLFALDRVLAEFLAFLDEEIGAHRYILGLSADHGSPNIVEYEVAEGRPGKRISLEEMEAVLRDVDTLVEAHRGSTEALIQAVRYRLEQGPFIARAFTPRELASTGPADSVLEAYRRSYIPGLSWNYPLWDRSYLETGRLKSTHPARLGIIAELQENAQIWTARAAHGGAYVYDREVPILIKGPGVVPGVSVVYARTIDLAPTLAALAGIDVPTWLDGSPLPMPQPAGQDEE